MIQGALPCFGPTAGPPAFQQDHQVGLGVSVCVCLFSQRLGDEYSKPEIAVDCLGEKEVDA